jgi:hypothetical protein
VTLTNIAVSESPAISCNYASGVLGDLAVGATISYTCGLVVISDTVNPLVAEGQALIDDIAIGPFVSDTASAQVLVASLIMTKTAFVDGYREVTSPGVFNPSECALASTITVPVSSTVKYCYTITNTGSYTLFSHTLVDDHMVGAILTDFPFALGPGASVTSVAAGEIPTQTLMITTTNVATWTAAVPTLAGALPAAPTVVNASATVNISGPALDQDGDGYLDNDEGSSDLDDDGIPNYLDDADGRPPVDVDFEMLIPFAGK